MVNRKIWSQIGAQYLRLYCTLCLIWEFMFTVTLKTCNSITIWTVHGKKWYKSPLFLIKGPLNVYYSRQSWKTLKRRLWVLDDTKADDTFINKTNEHLWEMKLLAESLFSCLNCLCYRCGTCYSKALFYIFAQWPTVFNLTQHIGLATLCYILYSGQFIIWFLPSLGLNVTSLIQHTFLYTVAKEVLSVGDDPTLPSTLFCNWMKHTCNDLSP